MSGTPIKVLGIVCSLRKGGNTEILVRESLAGSRVLSVNLYIIFVQKLGNLRLIGQTGYIHPTTHI